VTGTVYFTIENRVTYDQVRLRVGDGQDGVWEMGNVDGDGLGWALGPELIQFSTSKESPL
jgi:hypothetical protein